MHFVLNSLPNEYAPLKISYNTHKEQWSMNELLTMCVQEEGRLKHENLESAHLVAHGKGNANKGNNCIHVNKDGIVPMKKEFNKDGCFFCKKVGT